MTGSQSIDYEALQQEAMRNVVRAVLARTAKSGLPGDHHFYVSFDTTAPGVSLSKRLKEKYPTEMTIVLQHRFWDLLVTEDRFEVKLTFDGIPERLVVPFMALKVFIDPSVRYGLQFEDPSRLAQAEGEAVGTPDDTDDGRPRGTRAIKKPRQPKRPRVVDTETTKPADVPPDDAPSRDTPRVVPARPQPATRSIGDSAAGSRLEPASSQDIAKEEPAAQPAANGAQIVSLDQFRKK
ncbi:MAG: ClpXP protease specificity-enhancing factor SspB [Hyphomicrobium sp.]|nr:ClpXP protease specificity-enhancing factor SspB [Hyphomicrobium sp.]